LAYAAGALTIVPGPVEQVDLTIVQPNAPGQKVRRWSLTVVDVLMWVHEVLIPGIRRAQEEPNTFFSGPQCRFCPATPVCPHLHQKATEQAMQQFGMTDTNDDIARWLDEAEAVETWIDSVRALAKSKLEHQEAIPGWELAPTRPTRSWDDPTAVEDLLLRAGLPQQDYLETKLRSPAQLQKRLKPGHWAAVAARVQAISSGTRLSRKE